MGKVACFMLRRRGESKAWLRREGVENEDRTGSKSSNPGVLRCGCKSAVFLYIVHECGGSYTIFTDNLILFSLILW